jgi:TraY domain
MSKTIQVKGVTKELRQRLEASAERNFRSLDQETLARLEFSFDIEDALASKLHQRWIDQAMRGTFKPGSIDRLRQIAARAKSAA